MLCPICGALSENVTSADFDGLAVRCKHCGEFEIEDAALNNLLRLQEPARVVALERAKRSARKQVPTITSTCL